MQKAVRWQPSAHLAQPAAQVLEQAALAGLRLQALAQQQDAQVAERRLQQQRVQRLVAHNVRQLRRETWS